MSVAIHQEDTGAMVDGVAAARLLDLLREDAILFLDPFDVVRLAGQGDPRATEQAGVAPDLGRAVALRVDGDEHDRHGIIAFAELAPELDQACEGGRAYVRTVGEAEEDRGGFAIQARAREWPGIASHQR